MSKIEEFKEFVKNNPSLINHVKNNNMTWQKFYEIYDLYGKDNDVWNEYLIIKEEKKTEEKKSSSSWNNIMDMAKNLDVNKVQDGITSMQKALGLFGDLFTKNNPTGTSTSTYRPRPLYRTFED